MPGAGDQAHGSTSLWVTVSRQPFSQLGRVPSPSFFLEGLRAFTDTYFFKSLSYDKVVLSFFRPLITNI